MAVEETHAPGSSRCSPIEQVLNADIVAGRVIRVGDPVVLL
jgi:hypothetical protein